MASKKTRAAGKAGKTRLKERQRKLMVGNKKEGKTVTLKVAKEKYWKEKRAKIKQEIKVTERGDKRFEKG